MTPQLSDKAKQSLNRVIRRFETGDLSPIVEVLRIQQDARDRFPAGEWSLANQILAFIQTGGILDCRGFRQWEQVNRHVIKGAQAVYILAPLTYTATNDAPEGHPEPVTRIKGFRTIPVFPVTMTDGYPLPAFDYTPAELPPLYEVAQRLGVAVEYGPIGRGDGWYNNKHKQIRLGTHAAPIFFHELAHAAHAKLENFKGGQHADQETVAEFSAAVLSELYGIPFTGNAWHYIKAYNPADPLTAIHKALSTVAKVIALITN
jgi:hypothetical protein